MSFIYNQKELYSTCTTKVVDFNNAEMLSNFYVSNSNPTKLDIEQFSKQIEMDMNSVIAYIKERKKQDIINKNLVFLKFGREYIQPTLDQIKEYTDLLKEIEMKKLTASQINSKELEKDVFIDSDLCLEEIPKNKLYTNKLDKPGEFDSIKINKKENLTNSIMHNNKNNFDDIKIKKISTNYINNNCQNNKKLENNNNNLSENSFNSQNKSNNQNEENQYSSNSLGRLFNNYYQHSFLPDGIQDTRLINNLILFMKKDLKLDQKSEVAITLSKTNNPLVMQKFLEINGAEILSSWLQELREKLSDLPNNVSQSFVDNILLNLLSFCEKLKISLQDLKYSKIGKVVNKISKCNLENKEIQTKCVELVNKWKKIVEETKEKKEEKTSTIESEKVKANKASAHIHHSVLKKSTHEETNKNYSSQDIERNKQNINQNQHDFLNKKKYSDKSASINNANADKNNKKPKTETSESSEYNRYQDKDFYDYQANKNIHKNNASQIKPISQIVNGLDNPLSVSGNLTQIKKGALKGILKASPQTGASSGNNSFNNKMKAAEKKKLKFEAEVKLEKIKIFKLTDEPNAPSITDDEYQQIQLELLKDPTRSYLGDMKLRESMMEKENLFKMKEKIRIAKDNFDKIIPEIRITRPLELHLVNQNEEGEEEENILISPEKESINQLLNRILMTTYFRDSDIPHTPKMGKSEMYEFFDENIPKIENFKKSFDSEKPIYEFDFSKIDHIESNPELLKSLAERINKAELSFSSEEEKNKILAILQNQVKKTEESSRIGQHPAQILNPIMNNIIPNSISTINPLATANLLNLKLNLPIPNQIPQNLNNPIFPLQHMNVGHIPITPTFNTMNNVINPNNLMGLNINLPPQMNMNYPNNQNIAISQQQNIPNVNQNMMNIKNSNINSSANTNMKYMNRNQQNNRNINHQGTMQNFNSSESRKGNYMNQEKTINPNKFRTRPCRNFHGPNGCQRGEDCHFIHDKEYAGVDIPPERLNSLINSAANNDSQSTSQNINQNNSYYNNSNNTQNNRFRNYRNFNSNRINSLNNNFTMNNFNKNNNQSQSSSNSNYYNQNQENSWTPVDLNKSNPNGGMESKREVNTSKYLSSNNQSNFGSEENKTENNNNMIIDSTNNSNNSFQQSSEAISQPNESRNNNFHNQNLNSNQYLLNQNNKNFDFNFNGLMRNNININN